MLSFLLSIVLLLPSNFQTWINKIHLILSYHFHVCCIEIMGVMIQKVMVRFKSMP